jgi:formate/nitrite transporter FocA (FNT family)
MSAEVLQVNVNVIIANLIGVIIVAIYVSVKIVTSLSKTQICKEQKYAHKMFHEGASFVLL